MSANGKAQGDIAAQHFVEGNYDAALASLSTIAAELAPTEDPKVAANIALVRQCLEGDSTVTATAGSSRSLLAELMRIKRSSRQKKGGSSDKVRRRRGPCGAAGGGARLALICLSCELTPSVRGINHLPPPMPPPRARPLPPRGCWT